MKGTARIWENTNFGGASYGFVVNSPYVGDAMNDMASDADDSWKMQLQKTGFTVETIMKGLGENSEMQNIYVQHVRDAIADKRGGHD